MRSFLITGGTGYFGQGMVRRLLEMPDEGVYRICVYSRDEAKQAIMRATLQDPDERIRWFVGDVRDQARLRRAMEGVDTVIHAAALKRVEVGEYNPGEMIKTNVIGTMNVIEAATDAGVKKVVALSTDKACHPVNAYGASKLLLEKQVLAANNTRGAHGPRFAVTRYGNVAGSTGSVINNWRSAKRTPGATVVVTNTDATRFWMTLREAVDLVLKTSEHMHGGELVVPDLPAYRLADLMAAMNIYPAEGAWTTARAHYPVKIVGLSPGEKLHERMKEDGEDSSQARRMTVAELREALKNV